jgi:suppressor for copper-sensitivity B
MAFALLNFDVSAVEELLAILGLALAGGLILNLMPCVLPVLSIKLMGVVTKGGLNRHEVRLGFLASAAGILFAFMVLATATIAARAAGLAVGWGMQFQHPLFLVALSLFCVLFAANLWDLFEIRLPPAIANRIGGPHRGHGVTSDFLGGMFATVFATPCSAPFLGTAIAFALTRGPIEILAVFAALGTGLALPYLLVTLMPGLANRLPRPGPWMIVLRRVFGFALVATAIWLITVLAAQVATIAALSVGACLGVLMLVLWAQRRLPRLTHALALVFASALSALAFVLPGLLQSTGNISGAVATEGLWRAFDVAEIKTFVAEGRVVFVDVTADWCLSCQVNKKLVLDRAPVATRFANENVVAMKADWTRPSDEIAAYLASFRRYGIPLSVVYGPHAPDGIPLPEILTTATVLDALRKAAGQDARPQSTK